ncbi:MAG: DUF4166 domain-containing protein [Alphaproteobacteria bacterium]|nr:DUF4166 domain-containing protein [Alphaproteobacteria bacterium]
MPDSVFMEGVWFVYDGECPLCRSAALALRIRETVGRLHLLNAREAGDHPLMRAINARGLNLDEGMVLYQDGQYYHGADALRLMALLGEANGWFNCLNRWLFRSEGMARWSYPFMRAARNALISMRGVRPIRNLASPDTPIFTRVFGEAWEALPPVLRRHYANRAYRRDTVTVEGRMDVMTSPWIGVLSPLLRLAGTLVPYAGTAIPVTVHFRSEPDSDAFCFDRIFHFPGKAPYAFRSRMVPVQGAEMIEYMRFGIGWRTAYSYEKGKIMLRHRGYVLGCGAWRVSLPLEWVLGTGSAEEEAISEDVFRMRMEIRHWFFGITYAYGGEFRVIEVQYG